MSIAWMNRVWGSEQPRRSTHRLLLLALADNANDEGVCWPSVATLGRKCATDDRRTMLRQLEWLETEGFIVRERRAGRSTVYRLLLDRLGGDGVPTGGGAPMGLPPRGEGHGPMGVRSRGGTAPTGLRSPGGGTGPTGGVGVRSPEPTENHHLTMQQHAAGTRGDPVLRKVEQVERTPVHAAAEDETEEDAARLLLRRGVDAPVAAQLVRAHGERAVQDAVALYDERRRGTKPPAGPGWLVAALRRGFAGATKGGAVLLTHDEMLRWCEANGGLHRTSEFEPVQAEAGGVQFRRQEGGA